MELKTEIKRKLFHLVSSCIPIGYLILGKEIALVVIGLIYIFSLSLETARLISPPARKWIHLVFGPIMRAFEENKVSGATYLLLGTWFTIFIFEKHFAVAALLMLTLSDTAAAIVGVAYGKIKLWDKSLEGSLAFFITAGIIVLLLPGIGLRAGMVGISVGTLVELLPIPANDNLTVPMLSAAAMTFTAV